MKSALRKIIPLCLAVMFLAACSGPVTTTTETTKTTTVQESATVTATVTTSVTETTTTTASPAPSPGPSATTATPRPTGTTPTPTYEFRESNPDLPDVKAAEIASFGDAEVPIEDFLLRESDLDGGVTLEGPVTTNVVEMGLLIESFLEADIPELLPVIEYNNTFIDNGFLRKVLVGSPDGTFQQEIDLISSAESAKRIMVAIPEPSVELLRATFESVVDDFQAETHNVGSAALGQNAWELTAHVELGNYAMTVRMVAARHENLISIITISSEEPHPVTGASAAPRPVAYSAETDEDALALSELAIARIRAQLQNYRQTVTVDNGRFVGLLKLLPAGAFTGGEDYLTVMDYASIRDLSGAIIPDEVNDNTIVTYIQELYDTDIDMPFLWTGSMLGGYSRPEIGPRVEKVGFDLFDVDMEIFTTNAYWYLQELPFYVALSGTFDSTATARAMNTQSGWADEVKAAFHVASHNGAAVYSWEDGVFDESLATEPPLLDRLGRMFPLAVTDNNVFYSDTADNVFGMLDASLGAASSLADNSSYVAIARHMADAGVYSFIVGNEALVNTQEFQNDESDAPLLRPFRDFGVGAGYDDDLGPYMTLVLVHEDEQTAEENSRLLIQRINETWWIRPVDWEESWREYVDFVLVNVQDNIVTAKLYGDRAGGFWREWIPEERPLLLHE